MAILRGLGIIFACLWVGETLVGVLHLPLPGSIVGLLLLAGLLHTKVVKEAWVKEVSDTLIRYMSFFFIPPGVALGAYWGVVRAEWCPIVVSTVISTLLVLLTTAATYHFFIARRK